MTTTALAFELPRALEATAPPEERGVARDSVRLMVADAAQESITHAAFTELGTFLTAGDLVVVNVSQTLPAAVAATRADGSAVRIHFATRAPELDDRWRVVELRSADGATPARGRAGESIRLPGPGGTAIGELALVAPYASGSRLMLARLDGRAPSRTCCTTTGSRSATATSPAGGRSRPTRTCTRGSRAAPRCPAPGAPSPSGSSPSWPRAGSRWRPVTLHTGVSSPSATSRRSRRSTRCRSQQRGWST